MAVPELGVPLKVEHIAPIGSNTKLFTAVSVWQLHERGKLDVTQPFTRYANTTALGLPRNWCPRLANANGTAVGACLTPPTLGQLLHMSGGILDASNCEYPAGSWQLKYCFETQKKCSPAFAPDNFVASVAGDASAADVLKAAGVLLAPFDFLPGKQYHYSNEAYILASHVVEHVSGLPLGAYFERNIFKPLGLDSTIYDIANGQDGVYMDTVPYPSYVAYLNPVEIAQPATDKQYIGNSSYAAGTLSAAALGRNSRGAAATAAATAGEPGRWAKTGRAAAPSFPGSDFAWAGGAGAIQSSVGDVARWLRVFTTEPQRLGLKPDTVRRMLDVSIQIPAPKQKTALGTLSAMDRVLKRLRFAQGVVVVRDPSNRRLGASGLYYKGSLGAFDATYYLALHPTDPSKDVLAYVISMTNALVQPYAPFISRSGKGANSACVFNAAAAAAAALGRAAPGASAAAPLPAYMCDAKDLGGSGAPAALVLSSYLKAFTGKGILGV